MGKNMLALSNKYHLKLLLELENNIVLIRGSNASIVSPYIQTLSAF